MRTLRLLLLSLVLTAAAPASFTPYLVKDINLTPTPASSNPTGFVTLGGLALFQVPRDEVSGGSHSGLWRSDGTASGTYRLLETEDVKIGAVAGNRCFFSFVADDGRSYLGITDGTRPGTFPLAETSALWWSTVVWVPRQGVLYFASQGPEGGNGTELWRSDGTPGGTYEVADLLPGPDSSNPEYLTSFRGRLYFAAASALWQSDGTAAGTVQVRDVPAASLQVVGSRLVFVGTDAHGSELWASDGTPAGTRRIADLAAGAGSPSFAVFQVAGKNLFFSATVGTRGSELYVTDGTAQGTRRLTSFSDPDALDHNAWTMAPLGNRLLFSASDPAHGRELWSSDGTPKGTRIVLDARTGESSSNPGFFLQRRGRLYYQSSKELWTTDGTAAGTRRVKDVCHGICGPWEWIVDPSGDHVFLVTYYDWGIPAALWTTDGTAEGTVGMDEFWGGEDLSFDGTVAGGGLLFSGQDDNGIELWRSDGTKAGTNRLVDIADEDLGGSRPHGLMTLGQGVLFFARDDAGYALWRSDGTEAGTTAVKRGLGGRELWTASATRVFFEATRLQQSLWTSDGTEAGTVRLTPGGVRSQGELSAPVIKLGSRVFFSAWSRQYGAEPWITDGTPAGTRQVADLQPGPGHSFPRGFTVFAGRAWFAAGLHLWTSDGTAQGTVALGPELGTIESLTVHGGRLWFLGDGRELWSTDGTAAGMRKLILPRSSTFRILRSDGARLYLADSRAALWVSDGTAAGTRKISDDGIQDGPSIAFAGRLYYVSATGSLYTSDGTAADTREVRPDGEPRNARLLRFGDRLVALTHQGELWQSDGTAAGTQRVGDLSQDHYHEGEIVKAGPRLFFPGWDKPTGWELWAMRE